MIDDVRRGALSRSIQVKGIFVVLFQRRVLRFFPEKTVTRHQDLNFRAHEASKGVFGRADDRLPSHIETGIHQYRTTSLRLKGRD